MQQVELESPMDAFSTMHGEASISVSEPMTQEPVPSQNKIVHNIREGRRSRAKVMAVTDEQEAALFKRQSRTPSRAYISSTMLLQGGFAHSGHLRLRGAFECQFRAICGLNQAQARAANSSAPATTKRAHQFRAPRAQPIRARPNGHNIFVFEFSWLFRPRFERLAASGAGRA